MKNKERECWICKRKEEEIKQIFNDKIIFRKIDLVKLNATKNVYICEVCSCILSEKWFDLYNVVIKDESIKKEELGNEIIKCIKMEMKKPWKKNIKTGK